MFKWWNIFVWQIQLVISAWLELQNCKLSGVEFTFWIIYCAKPQTRSGGGDEAGLWNVNLTLKVKTCHFTGRCNAVVINICERMITMASVKVAVRVRPINKRYTLWFTDVTHFWRLLHNSRTVQVAGSTAHILVKSRLVNSWPGQFAGAAAIKIQHCIKCKVLSFVKIHGRLACEICYLRWKFSRKTSKAAGCYFLWKFTENSQSILATFCENLKICQEKHQRARPKVLPIEAGTGKAFGLPRRLAWQNLHKGH